MQKLNLILKPVQIAELIRKAVPEIESRKASLAELLEKQEWEVASKHAHNLKSSICLFSRDKLLLSLDSIEKLDLDKIQSSTFRESFEHECQELITELQNIHANCTEN